MLMINPSKQAARFLKTLPEKHAKQLAKKIMLLRENPAPNDMKKLVNTSYLRVDAGEYRTIYFVEAKTLYILYLKRQSFRCSSSPFFASRNDEILKI